MIYPTKDCLTKGNETTCPKCGRQNPDLCGDKHPRLSEETIDYLDPTLVNADAEIVAEVSASQMLRVPKKPTAQVTA